MNSLSADLCPRGLHIWFLGRSSWFFLSMTPGLLSDFSSTHSDTQLKTHVSNALPLSPKASDLSRSPPCIQNTAVTLSEAGGRGHSCSERSNEEGRAVPHADCFQHLPGMSSLLSRGPVLFLGARLHGPGLLALPFL